MGARWAKDITFNPSKEEIHDGGDFVKLEEMRVVGGGWMRGARGGGRDQDLILSTLRISLRHSIGAALMVRNFCRLTLPMQQSQKPRPTRHRKNQTNFVKYLYQ